MQQQQPRPIENTTQRNLAVEGTFKPNSSMFSHNQIMADREHKQNHLVSFENHDYFYILFMTLSLQTPDLTNTNPNNIKNQLQQNVCVFIDVKTMFGTC
jgi:hypothetical protein